MGIYKYFTQRVRERERERERERRNPADPGKPVYNFPVLENATKTRGWPVGLFNTKKIAACAGARTSLTAASS